MYTNTIIKIEIDEKVIKALKLDALTRSKLFFKLTTKLAVPFAGVLDGAFSADRSLVCASVASLLSQHLDQETFEETQLILFGSIVEDGEALATPEAINKWFEYNDVNPIDLFVWLVDENLVTLFKGSKQLQSLKPKFDEFYKKFEDFIPQTVVSDDSIKE